MWGSALHSPASLGARGVGRGSEELPELDEQVNVHLTYAANRCLCSDGYKAAVGASIHEGRTACSVVPFALQV